MRQKGQAEEFEPFVDQLVDVVACGGEVGDFDSKRNDGLEHVDVFLKTDHY